jgi:hypothetical protein
MILLSPLFLAMALVARARAMAMEMMDYFPAQYYLPSKNHASK